MVSNFGFGVQLYDFFSHGIWRLRAFERGIVKNLRSHRCCHCLWLVQAEWSAKAPFRHHLELVTLHSCLLNRFPILQYQAIVCAKPFLLNL